MPMSPHEAMIARELFEDAEDGANLGDYFSSPIMETECRFCGVVFEHDADLKECIDYAESHGCGCIPHQIADRLNPNEKLVSANVRQLRSQASKHWLRKFQITVNGRKETVEAFIDEFKRFGVAYHGQYHYPSED